VELRVLSWNLFHGRDFPPEAGLFTLRSRLLRITERNATHAQVNRDLLPEFSGLLASADWDVALLQECPPRWAEPLAAATGSEAHRALTSRNSLAPLRGALARLNPDLIASNEGGSNLTLVRRSAAPIAERREAVIHSGAPERRTMAFTRLAIGVCVANLHASGPDPLAETDVLRAAVKSVEWVANAPLILGGDLNVRPADSYLYRRLERRFGLAGAISADAIDHLLIRDLAVIEPGRAWPPDRREVPAGPPGSPDSGLRLRLSDHAPVAAIFAVDAPSA
jgi:endonuclease/exonuclease/phosphatase family metal-dependent hydrolase